MFDTYEPKVYKTKLRLLTNVYMETVPLTVTTTHAQNHYDDATVDSVQSVRRICSLFLHTQKTAYCQDVKQEVYLLIYLFILSLGYGLGRSGDRIPVGARFSHLSRPALWFTQHPVQWVPGLSEGRKRPGRDPDPSPPSSAEV
jgi:hypothetical protein